MSTTLIYIFGGILLCSALSVTGMLLFSIRHAWIEKSMLYVISFSTGALLGDVFLHMLPEMVEESTFLNQAWFLILGGVIASFILEKFIHWHHCHAMPDAEHHHHPVGIMSLVGDTLHNVIDGMLIAGAFMADTTLGIATTTAVIFHEIPQEISDYALLIYSGFSKGKALLFNAITTLSALIGAGLVIAFSNSIPNLEMYLIPLTAGNFLYIAGSDLIPELHKETAAKRSAGQLIWMLAGIGFMAALTMME